MLSICRCNVSFTCLPCTVPSNCWRQVDLPESSADSLPEEQEHT